MDRGGSGHARAVETGAPRVRDGADEAQAEVSAATPSLEEWYRDHFQFVWRSARRLGVQRSELDDAVQEVFMVVHRRLRDYEPRHSPRAWLFAITRRVAADHRRSVRRKGGLLPLHEGSTAAQRDDPARGAMNKERTDVILEFLAAVDEERREIFILCELEQFSAPEIAEAVHANTSTVYSRIRLTRQAFAQFVQTHHPELMGDADG
jgi:RNA polymerase sigma-70 factor, ECF subfamily